MTFTIPGLTWLFGLLNLGPIVWFLIIMPFVIGNPVSIEISGVRYGYGYGGWTVQEVKSYKVRAQGFFPWWPSKELRD